MILESASVGKPGEVLTERQLKILAAATANYLDAMAGREALEHRIVNLTPATPPPIRTDVAYKFTSDEGLGYWMAGRVRINPLTVYQTIENDGARDVREGLGLVYLAGETRFATVQSASGFNVGLLCTSSDARKTERRVRHEKFGNRLIKINRLAEFSHIVAELSGAKRHAIRDVVYSDAKLVLGTSDFPEWFAEVNGVGDLREETLEKIAEVYLSELAEKTFAASVGTKPVRYRTERERRVTFEFKADIDGPVDVQSDRLIEHLQVLV
jgi:hypothetical protein